MARLADAMLATLRDDQSIFFREYPPLASEHQLQANRQNALQSTGPKSEEGILACKNNALRHGLRALQTVVPGESADEWEIHRDAVVTDLSPLGAVETALAEQVAAKLWRLGRVVRYESDLIINGQDGDELARAHERTHHRPNSDLLYGGGPKKADIPTREDVTKAKKGAEEAERKVAERDEALRQLGLLAEMKDDDAFEDWLLYEVFRKDFRIGEDELDRIFKGHEDNAPFLARHARKMLQNRMPGTDGRTLEVSLAEAWQGKRDKSQAEAVRLRKAHRNYLSRYKAALARRHREHGLPAEDDLNRIQRYEAHLERGLHKTLDRLRELQEARGAVAPRPPSIAVAVVQTGADAAGEARLAPFGSFDGNGSGAGVEG